MQSLKLIRLAEVDNFSKQSFEQKKLIPLYAFGFAAIRAVGDRQLNGVATSGGMAYGSDAVLLQQLLRMGRLAWVRQ